MVGFCNRGIERQPSCIKDHREALARTLRMPHHTCAPVALGVAALHRRFDGMVHGMELVVPGDLLDRT